MDAGDTSVMDAGDFHARAGDCSTEHLESAKTLEEPVSPEGSLLEQAAEKEKAEPANSWEAWVRQQRLLHQFDAVHDEAQRLRVMNLLLQSKMRRYLKRRAKSMGSTSSSFSVRHQLEAEMNRAALEEWELQQRLDAARQLVAEREAQLQQLQERAMSKLHAPPGRRQEAERMLKRVWPQLQRLCKERLLHSRAKHEVESARQQVAELDVFGPQRTLAAYEEMEANAAKLAEHEHERAEQLYALGSVAERDLQQAAHLEDTLLGTRQAILEARRRDVQASVARQEVVKAKMHRDDLYKERNELTRKMELMAYPELLRDHEEVRQQLQVAKDELDKVRKAYYIQEKRIATALRLLQQREQGLREVTHGPSSYQPFTLLRMDAKCGPSLHDLKRDR
ncbi:golgin subfamily A member 6-like protein 1 [Schistocerca gregaria]|uniref:golgin subfamily A member 6-like protein 1 n=1 Tax=Schistocerca gregaria TaxID=7010 RepID=UPI00211ED04D|nr:golgin subfamily A member 6-like protein 1 [Schistocerca gregaria]